MTLAFKEALIFHGDPFYFRVSPVSKPLTISEERSAFPFSVDESGLEEAFNRFIRNSGLIITSTLLCI
jgi:hypothetical protein